MTPAAPGSTDGPLFASSPMAFFAKIASSDNPSLSYSEEFLWWSSRLAGDTTFNVRVLLQLDGPVHLEALDAAIVDLARRHETLRTVFPMERGVILRRLLAPESARPIVTDLAGVDPDARNDEAWRLVLEESNRSFNLTRGPLFRARILRLETERLLLQFTIHHIVIDGGSVDVLLRDLAALYAARIQGQPSRLAPLPQQYADHAAEVRARFQAGARDKALRYWRAQLDGSPSLLDLPTDAPRRAARHYPGQTIRFALSSDRTAALARLARDQRTTMFVVLLGVLKVLLARLSGDLRILVEAPFGNRRSVEAEAMVGLLVDLVALRTDLAANPSFVELLARVRRTTLGAFDHAGVPIHLLVPALNAKVDRSHSAICQVMFNLIDRRPRAAHLESLGARQLTLPDHPHSKFDLMLTVHLTDALELQLLYRRDLFSEARMEEFVRQFRALVDQVLADPAAPIDRLSLVTPECERVWRAAAWTTEAFALPQGSRIGVLPEASESVLTLARHAAARSGGRLSIADARHLESVDALYGDISSWRRLPRNLRVPALRYACFVGEVLVREDVGRVRAMAAGVTCAYFVDDERLPAPSACLKIPPDLDVQALRPILPIGRGIAGTDVRIVGRNRGPAGIGELGEIYVGLRATGLVGRLLPDGTIDRVGEHLDDRVDDGRHWGTVDGYTIRFDEVASAILRHPDVLDAHVRAERDADGGRELVAYVTTAPGQAWSAERLDQFAREELPDFMVPRRFVRVESLWPLSAGSSR